MQNDIHFGELTVRETLDFAAQCQASRTRKREWAGRLWPDAGAALGLEEPAVPLCVAF